MATTVIATISSRAWERLNQWQAPRKADLAYLRILRLAARTLESEVARALDLLLATTRQWNETDVERLLQPEPIPVPQLAGAKVDLQCYDQLLSEVRRADS